MLWIVTSKVPKSTTIDVGFMLIRPDNHTRAILFWIIRVVGRSFPIGVSDQSLYSCRHPNQVQVVAPNIRVLKFDPLILLCDYSNYFILLMRRNFAVVISFRSPIQIISRLVVGWWINERKTNGDTACGPTSRTGPGICLVWKSLSILCEE